MRQHTPRKPEIKRGTVDVPWIAAYLGINLNAAYALVKTPGFPCIKIGKRFVIPKAAFFRWLEQAALDKQSYDTAENQ
jgi:hypothetical protein